MQQKQPSQTTPPRRASKDDRIQLPSSMRYWNSQSSARGQPMTSLDELTTERYPMGKHTRALRTAEFELQPPRKAPTPSPSDVRQHYLNRCLVERSCGRVLGCFAQRGPTGLGEEGPSRGGRRLWRVPTRALVKSEAEHLSRSRAPRRISDFMARMIREIRCSQEAAS